MKRKIVVKRKIRGAKVKLITNFDRALNLRPISVLIMSQ